MRWRISLMRCRNALIPIVSPRQIYENLAASAAGSVPSASLQETRLRPDVYYLEKRAVKPKR